MIIGQNTLLNQYVPTFYIKNIIDGQTLRYDSTRKAFVNATPTGGSGGASKLGELLNVSPTVDSPSLSLLSGQSLTYNAFTSLWENSFTDYNTLLNKPTSSSFSFAGLSDTTKPPLSNGYVLWNATGTQLVYSTTIPVTSITGLAPVASLGTAGSLYNISPLSDTLNNTTDVGKILVWNGTVWTPSLGTGVNVVADLTTRNALPTMLGTQSYVINSDDGAGNYVNQWSYWIYTISGPSNGWTLISRQETSISDSSTIEFTLTPFSPGTTIIGTLPTGGRITLITVEVPVSFIIPGTTLEIGYNIPAASVVMPSALMTITEIDLTSIGVYSTMSDILFGTDTPAGDVEITATYVNGGTVVGSAQIIVSYV
jgi:hypothetical protein